MTALFLGSDLEFAVFSRSWGLTPAPAVFSRSDPGDIPVVVDSCSATAWARLMLISLVCPATMPRHEPGGRDESGRAQGQGGSDQGQGETGVRDLTDDEALHSEGKADEVGGTVQEGYGKARRKIGEAVEDVGKNLKR